MEIMQEGNLPSVDSLDFVRGLSGGNSIKILPSALLKNAGALLQTSLPASGVNVVGNYDGNISGYGWYNNSADPTGTYAPPSSAGIPIVCTSNFKTDTRNVVTTIAIKDPGIFLLILGQIIKIAKANEPIINGNNLALSNDSK